MQTLDQSLIKAYQDGLISEEEALRFADSANDVRLQIKLQDRGDFGAGNDLGIAIDDPDNEGQFHGRI
jgi:twitching motility protein PilU